MLRSFQSKKIWAHYQMEALRKEITSFGAANSCVVIHDFESKGLKHTWRVQGNPAIPPASISLRLGDTLFNFRGVLDHLAQDLVIANHRTPTRRTAFPIVTHSSDWKASWVTDQLAGMDDGIRARIDMLQPYRTQRSESTNYFLGLLNSLGNVEKHRHFNLIAACVDLAAFSVDSSELTSCFIYNGPVEDGTILAAAHGQMDVDFLPAFGVAFGQSGEAPGKLVDKVILRIELAVEEAVGELAWFCDQHAHLSAES